MRPSPFFTLDSIITRDYTSLLWEITLHCCERLHFIVVRDYTSLLREITLHCCERLHFIVVRDYFSIWIIQPAVRFNRRLELTADSFILSTHYSAVYLYSPRLRRRYRRSILTALMRPSLFILYKPLLFRLHFIITRDYTSSLREITLHHYERLHFIITRDYSSSLREITLHCYERLHFIITRDYTSSLREITLHCYERLHFIVTQIKYLNYTTRRPFLP
jgi:hypothetical protein